MKDLKIGEGIQVKLHFALQLEDGETVDSTFDKEPATLTIGDGNLPEGFESCLYGLVEGDKKSFTVLPEKAFGQHNPSNVQRVSRADFTNVDELEEGILLIKIKQDALVFNRNGQLEQVLLNLDKTAKLNQQPEQKLSQPASAATNDLPSQVTEQRVGSRALEETFGPEFRQSLVRDPLQLMSYISVSPSSKEGQLQGFVLQPGSKPELFKHFGLQAGDLLVAVDGDLVSDTSAMMALHSRLATAEGVDIDLMRGDERLRIRIEME